MRKKTLRDHKGITLVEIIIVIAILGILASTVVGMLGHLHYADTQKVVKTLDTSLDALQVKTMSKTGQFYMYVYKSGGNYYVRTLQKDLDIFDSSVLNTDGTRLCNDTISIWKVSWKVSAAGKKTEEKTEVKDMTYIKIAYTKSALFDTTNTNTDKIYIDGVPDYTLTLVKDTGKHFVSQ